MLIGSSLAASALWITGCATTRDQLVPGSFAWFDLVTKDPDAAKAFYSAMFGWQIGSPASDGYRAIRGGGEALGGMIAAVDAASNVDFPSQWVPVLSVADALQATKTALANGGKQVRAPFSTTAGTFSTVRDSRGALVVLYSGSQGFPLDAKPTQNTWYWVDLITDSPSRSKSFYRAVAGFETRQHLGQTVFTRDGSVRGGVVQVARSRVEPTWLPYVAVADVAKAVARSRDLGGGPLTVSNDSAVLLDPTGAAIGVSQIGGAAG